MIVAKSPSLCGLKSALLEIYMPYSKTTSLLCYHELTISGLSKSNMGGTVRAALRCHGSQKHTARTGDGEGTKGAHEPRRIPRKGRTKAPSRVLTSPHVIPLTVPNASITSAVDHPMPARTQQRGLTVYQREGTHVQKLRVKGTTASRRKR